MRTFVHSRRCTPACMILALLCLAACDPASSGTPSASPSATANGGKLNVVATTTQIKSMAQSVGGDLVTVRSILPPGADAHEFEPRPSDVQAIAESAVVLKNGIGLDDWIDELIENAGGTRPLVTISDGIPLHKEEGEESSDDAHGTDPHVWFDVTNAMTMTRNIRDAYISVDPSNSAAYEANTSAYLEDLSELDQYIRGLIAEIPSAQRKVVTNHDAFGYYLDAYGLTFAGSIIPSLSTEAQPSAQDIADLLATIEREGVKVIFLESSGNPQLANQIAKDADIKVVDTLYSDSLGPEGSPGATYEGMMRYNTDTIVDALK